MSKRETVIVIGAGVSGLACAAELSRAGCEVVVLEARARIGGRVWTDERLGFPADLGAAWVMGHEENPVTAVAQAAGAELVPTNWDSLAAYYKGQRVSDDELAALNDEYADLIDGLKEGARARSADLSLAAALEHALGEERLSAAERAGFDFACQMLALDAAADMDELGLIGQEYDQRPDGEDAMVRGGYGLVPRQLARGLTVHTEHIVTRIQHGSSGVIVETNQGRFLGTRCVVSLPLGVLKSGTVAFAPALPYDKLTAIARLQMGTLDKVVLVLPRRLFPVGASFVGRLGDEPERFPLFADLERLVGRPVIVGFVAGKLARALEKQSDAEFIAQAMRTLRELFGSSVPEPLCATVVRWSADPYSRGSYSYVPVGARESDRDILAAPVGECLYFCGEATMRNQAGTVHGAYRSGRRAAAAILGTSEAASPAGKKQSPFHTPISRRRAR